jgi:hypothetical protein
MGEHDRLLCTACTEEECEDFKHACIHESMAKNDIWLKKYKIMDWPRWDYSMEDATLTFSEEGKVKVICDMQVVGSTCGNSWEWSWGNITYPMACRNRMDEVRVFGEEKEWGLLSTLFLTNDEYLGWACAAIANHVLNGIGAYRCSSGPEGDFVYVVILASRFVN